MQNGLKWLRAAFRRVVYLLFTRHFVAGETFAEALPNILRLRAQGFCVTVDILGEAVKNDTHADTNTESYILLIGQLDQNNIPVNISVKLTALGLRKPNPRKYAQACSEKLEKVLCAAGQYGDAFVRVDMEDSPFTDETLKIVSDAYVKHRGMIGPVLQAALHRTEIDALILAQKGIRIRLCKGAYQEAKDIADSNPNDIRDSYIRAAEYLLSSNATYPAFATHDDLLIKGIKNIVQKHSISHDAFEFQMLYGVRIKLQQQLIAEGYNVRVYVPYGRDWWKYFHRRLKEGNARNLLWMLARNIITK